MNKLVVVITLGVILAAVNWSIYQKEQLIAHGQGMYLALAPVDPRSLMQGDYMALGFAMADQIAAALLVTNNTSATATVDLAEGVDNGQRLDSTASVNNSEGSDTSGSIESSDTSESGEIADENLATSAEISFVDSSNHDGLVLVALDDNQQASFLQIYDGKALGAKQLLIKYRLRDGEIKLASNAFFFEEGQAAAFESARFGYFKVATNGDLLLVSLHDKDFRNLAP
ncbi:GDYXXLXY domain-containing protein [Shewanella sp. SNU WT4]|uniref:GDYXXLXY domain-containing protein n=1 Tax=Shewanella sp. SNU WT4 TaxID=2590015 RepID=UPI0011288A11|nr:GDYXXLXY domain-containing protein [Shewanella sp. SNU WT4]QDF67969.1 GDYXXLXY domain-containing protein [Shewanella sp. SNU WT4]